MPLTPFSRLVSNPKNTVQATRTLSAHKQENAPGQRVLVLASQQTMMTAKLPLLVSAATNARLLKEFVSALLMIFADNPHSAKYTVPALQ